MLEFYPEEIEEYISAYFQNLYQSSVPDIPEDLDGLISAVFSDQDNQMLCGIPSVEEIHTLLSMGSYKAPRPNGMTTIFYKKFWDILGQDVIKMVQSFFIYGFMLREINHCHIVLIP